MSLSELLFRQGNLLVNGRSERWKRKDVNARVVVVTSSQPLLTTTESQSVRRAHSTGWMKTFTVRVNIASQPARNVAKKLPGHIPIPAILGNPITVSVIAIAVGNGHGKRKGGGILGRLYGNPYVSVVVVVTKSQPQLMTVEVQYARLAHDTGPTMTETFTALERAANRLAQIVTRPLNGHKYLLEKAQVLRTTKKERAIVLLDPGNGTSTVTGTATRYPTKMSSVTVECPCLSLRLGKGICW